MSASPHGTPSESSGLQHFNKDWLAEAFAEQVDQLKRPELYDVEQDQAMAKEVILRLKPYRDTRNWRSKSRSLLNQSSFALDVFEAGLSCFFTCGTFLEGLNAAENVQSEDAPALGVIFGALAGTFYGINGIPTELVIKFQNSDALEETIGIIMEMRKKQLDDFFA